MAEYRFLMPLDVLFLRGNKLFGEAGHHGEAQMPPWPSVAAGAIRSRILADADVDIAAFAAGTPLADTRLSTCLGTPSQPGAFRIGWFSLAVRTGEKVEPIIQLPADLMADEKEDGIRYVNPQPLPARLKAGAATAQLTVLRQPTAAKPQGGLWLNRLGVAAWLCGEQLGKRLHTLRSGDLWKTDPRVGIALDVEKRSAAEGQLYTAEGVGFASRYSTLEDEKPKRDVGFLVAIGAADGLTPKDGLVRFGGDGRGARIETCEVTWPEPNWDRVAAEKRYRLVLATPGLFARGWLPPGMQDDDASWHGPDGVTARLVAAAVPRAQIVSGWDLAKWSQGKPGPKPALRAASAGSVYWFEDFKGDVAALRKLAAGGFGCFDGYPDRSRIAEGFNNVLIGNWASP